MSVDRQAADATTPPDVTDRPEIVEVVGEADRSTSHLLRARLDEVAARPGARVLVDLSSATFIDSSTLGVLAVSAKRFAADPRRFAIVCPPGEVHTMFELTALDRVVPLYPTRPDALDAIDRRTPPGAPPAPAP
jgi:anti-sigma B factor antagonist